MAKKRRGHRYDRNVLPRDTWVSKVPPRLHERCDATGKAIFSSEGAARKSLVGQMSTKHVRIYRCDAYPAHFHLTKTYNDRL